MELYGVGVYKKGFSDFGVGQTLDRELENLPFTVGKDDFRLFPPASPLEGIGMTVCAGVVRDQHFTGIFVGRQGHGAERQPDVPLAAKEDGGQLVVDKVPVPLGRAYVKIILDCQ